MPEQTARRLATESPEAPPNGQPTPKEKPPAPDVNIEYKPGDEVATTIKETVEKVSKVVGTVAPQANSQSKLTPEQAAALAARSRKRETRIKDLAEWLEYWRTFEGEEDYEDVSRFKMIVSRVADPLGVPGQASPYRVPCNDDRLLGEFPFTTSTNQFIQHLQSLEMSGGNFRVTLIDADGDGVKTWGGYNYQREFVPSESNYFWQGAIPNPPQAQKTETEKPKKEKTAKDFINELKEEIEGLKAIGLIPEKQEGGNSLLDSVNATAVATVITKLGDTLASIGEQGSKYTSGGDKGFVRSLAEGEEGQKRIWAGFDNVTMLLHGIASDYLQGRREKAKREFELEKIKLMKENPELAKTIQQQSEAEKAKEEDIYDYICRKCEEADKTFDITTDAKVQGMDKGSLTLIRGVLASDDTPETVLDKFIKVCGTRGKGERALKLKDLPQTIGFIERMQRAVKAAAQG